MVDAVYLPLLRWVDAVNPLRKCCDMTEDLLTSAPGGTHHKSVKEDCVRKAIEVIAKEGLEGLSLRAVARALGISHQAPYKHFPSRDHLLAEVIRRCLIEFAQALRDSGMDAAGKPLPPQDAMRQLGKSYLEYAAQNPLAYRLMFSTPWPDAARALDLSSDARAAFDILVECISRLKPDSPNASLRADALFIWTSIHGVAGAIESHAMGYLDFDQAETTQALEHAMKLAEQAVFGSMVLDAKS